jgi:hypothetical protein
MNNKVEITLFDGHLTLESGPVTTHIYSFAEISLRNAGQSHETKLTPQELIDLIRTRMTPPRTTRGEAMDLLRRIAAKVKA